MLEHLNNRAGYTLEFLSWDLESKKGAEKLTRPCTTKMRPRGGPTLRR